MKDGPRYQFGLSTLLWVMTGVAFLLSTAVTSFEVFGRIIALALAVIGSFCLVVVGVSSFLWIKSPGPDGDTHRGKVGTLLRSRGFWIAFCLALFIAFSLNYILYHQSYLDYRGMADGELLVGWPLTFSETGGSFYHERFSLLALCIDILVMLACVAVVGIAFRNGVGPVLECACMLFHKARTWPNWDDDSEINRPLTDLSCVDCNAGKDMSTANPYRTASKAAIRWFHLTPDHLLILLLVIEGGLYLSERFGWFPCETLKGWPVLIAVGCVSVTVLLVMLLWSVTPFVFRRWFRFGFGSFLSLLVVIAIPSVWLTMEIHKANRQRDRIAVIAKCGGTVTRGGEITYGYFDGRDWVAWSDISKLEWPLSLLGMDFFYDVAEVFYPRSRLTDDAFESVRRLKNLDSLKLCGRQITDAELQEVEGMTHLRTLWLDSTEVTDAGLRHLDGMENIECLCLRFSPITGAHFDRLGCLTRLTTLNLEGTNLTDAALRQLEEATNLASLDLRRTQVTAEGVQRLQQALPNCRIWWELPAEAEQQSPPASE